MKWLSVAIALAIPPCTQSGAWAADPARNAAEAHATIAQETAYQVDPIKIRIVGRESFEIHRMDVVANVPADYLKPFQKGDPLPKDSIQTNGKVTFYGKCINNSGLWHWGDCAQFADSFSLDVWVHARWETDPSGLGRPGYVIVGVKNGAISDIDTDCKVFFFNGPPTTVQEAHSTDCPYRLVINTKDQKEVVQAISMEPIVTPSTSERK